MSERLPSCHTRPGFPGRRAALVSLTESVTRCLAHRSHPEAGLRCVRQHAVRSASGPAPRSRLVLRLVVHLGARCVGPTSAISRLRTSTRASWVPGQGHALSLMPCPRSRLVHARETRFSGPHLTVVVHRGGVVFPSRCVRTRFGHPCRGSLVCRPLARTATGGSPRPPPARPREAVRVGDAARDAFRPTRTFAPRRPLERPAPAFACRAALPPRCRLSTPFHREGPCGPYRPGPRPRAQLLAGTRFYEPRRRLPSSANLIRRTGTP